MMSLFIPIFIIIFSLFILIKLEIKRECNSCNTVDVYVYTKKKIDDYNFLYLSDFHNSSNLKCIEKVESAIEDGSIDSIISGGDMVTYSPKRKTGLLYNNFITLLETIKKYHLKFYFGYGNHENRFRLIPEKFKNDVTDLEKYNCAIAKYDVDVVEDAYFEIAENIRLYEIALMIEYYKKKFSYNSTKKRLTNEDIKKHIGMLDKKYFNIILCHNPNYVENLIEYGFDLVLSGHQHGGLIRLPFLGSLFSPEGTFLPPYNKGQYKYKGKDILVSNGMGEHTIKIRFNNIPEIYKVHIVGE